MHGERYNIIGNVMEQLLVVHRRYSWESLEERFAVMVSSRQRSSIKQERWLLVQTHKRFQGLCLMSALVHYNINPQAQAILSIIIIWEKVYLCKDCIRLKDFIH